MAVNGNNHCCVASNGKISPTWQTRLLFENNSNGLSSRLPTRVAIRQTRRMTKVAFLMPREIARSHFAID